MTIFLPSGDCVGLDINEWWATDLTKVHSLVKQRWAKRMKRWDNSSSIGKLQDNGNNKDNTHFVEVFDFFEVLISEYVSL